MPGTVTPAIRQTIKLCLEKDPRKRIANIRDVKLALQGAFEAAGPRTDAASTAPRLGWLVAVAIVAAVAAAAVWTIKPAGRGDVQRIVAQIPATLNTPEAFYDGFALSPDGSMLAYAARRASGTRQIWIRQFDTDGARAARDRGRSLSVLVARRPQRGLLRGHPVEARGRRWRSTADDL